MPDNTTSPQLPWEQQILSPRRWGQDAERAKAEHARLRALWDAAQPFDRAAQGILDQILSLAICNWDLEGAIVALCEAIGAGQPSARGIGHMRSMRPERWNQVWAYYAALRNWLVGGDARAGYTALLATCDPDGAISGQVQATLGAHTPRKDLYVERLCLVLDYALHNGAPQDAAYFKAHAAAAGVLEEQFKTLGADEELLRALSLGYHGPYAGYHGMELCHHKFFRHLEILISSIGAEAWRATMPRKGTDGLERADLLEGYLDPIEQWVAGAARDEHIAATYARLGERTPARLFLAALLASLLRSGQMSATRRAENWLSESKASASRHPGGMAP